MHRTEVIPPVPARAHKEASLKGLTMRRRLGIALALFAGAMIALPAVGHADSDRPADHQAATRTKVPIVCCRGF